MDYVSKADAAFNCVNDEKRNFIFILVKTLTTLDENSKKLCQ